VPAALVKNFEDVFTDPHVLHRQMVLDLDDGEGASVRVPGDPIKLARMQRSRHSFPPRLGQDTRSVVKQALRVDEPTFEAWEADGLFGG
jgi:crotonobetainyl-CoA:carnitine CoA-transferase CaiB-like acyl-CoA transferase